MTLKTSCENPFRGYTLEFNVKRLLHTLKSKVEGVEKTAAKDVLMKLCFVSEILNTQIRLIDMYR